MAPNLWPRSFRSSAKANEIRQVRIAPYHPSSNGLAERAVRIFKEGLKKRSTGSLSDRIARTLFEYRRTPHTTTGVSPAELMSGRQLRSRLSLVRPDFQQKVLEKQTQQKSAHDMSAKHRKFAVGDSEAVVPEPVPAETPSEADPPVSGGSESSEPSSGERSYPSRERHPPDRFSS